VVLKAGEEVRLTAKEYALLRLMLLHRGKVITHTQLLRDLWGPNAGEQTHYLRVYMTRLRQKLEEDPTHPRHFRTEPGVGYRLMVE
jgi:two-component system KDP operon response regulator KdpE